jgi:Zn-dependent metalloprotease
MKKLALIAIILIAGCASTNARTSDSDPKLAQLEKKRQALEVSEKQCVDEAMKRSHDGIASITVTPNASLESQTQKINNTRDREISQCHALADHENAEIAEQERNEYESEEQQERSRAAFIAVLTTSRLQH